MGVWIPIDVNLDDDGAFAALSHLPRAAELKPKPLAPDQEPFGTWWANGSTLSVSVASRLGLSGIVDRSSSFNSTTITYDVALYSEALDSQGNGDIIYGTRWGAGLRARITVRDYQSKTTMSLSSVAAAASLGLVDASYQIEGIGISDPSLLKLLPDPGRFDEKSHGQLMDAVKQVETSILATKQGLTAMPFMIYVANAAFVQEPVDRARSFLFGARALAEKNPLRGALARADQSVDAVAVRTVYQKWADGTPEDHGPPQAAIDAATSWLQACGLNP